MLRTDQIAFIWLQKFREPEGQLARWMEILTGVGLSEVVHLRKEKITRNADAVSRHPLCNVAGKVIVSLWK